MSVRVRVRYSSSKSWDRKNPVQGQKEAGTGVRKGLVQGSERVGYSRVAEGSG